MFSDPQTHAVQTEMYLATLRCEAAEARFQPRPSVPVALPCLFRLRLGDWQLIRTPIESRLFGIQSDQREKEKVWISGDGRTGGGIPTVRELDGIRISLTRQTLAPQAGR